MSDKLPDNVVSIEMVRINRNITKRCKCEGRTFVVDPKNRSVYCGVCGAWVDPYEAMEDIAKHYDRLNNEVNRLLEQRRDIVNYKPWLLVFRNLESQYRSKKILPVCPHCGRGFFFEEIRSWTNRMMEERRRVKAKLGSKDME